MKLKNPDIEIINKRRKRIDAWENMRDAIANHSPVMEKKHRIEYEQLTRELKETGEV